MPETGISPFTDGLLIRDEKVRVWNASYVHFYGFMLDYYCYVIANVYDMCITPKRPAVLRN